MLRTAGQRGCGIGISEYTWGGSGSWNVLVTNCLELAIFQHGRDTVQFW
jgi:hypothetical protein